jgi:DNA-binding transcriptional LysR family regulator
VSQLRTESPDIAVSAVTAAAPVLTQRLIEGTLDLAVMYRPIQPPGYVIEHLFDEEFVLVSSARPGSRRGSSEYVFVDWGPDFQQDHAAAYPELINPGLNLDLGSIGVEYLLQNEASAYFPLRIVKNYLARGRLRQPRRAQKFVYPVYMVYPESRDEETYELIIDGLRQASAKLV